MFAILFFCVCEIFLASLAAIAFCCVVMLKIQATDNEKAKKQALLPAGSLFGSLLLTLYLFYAG